jgi:hypothetical protein
MFDNAFGYIQDSVEYRWIIKTKHNNRDWEIIVEPDYDEKLLVVITAYSI